MSIRVRLFASYREAAGSGQLDLPFVVGATPARIWDQLVGQFPDLPAQPTSAAINLTMADLDAELSDGDEVAFLPPVGGG